MDEILNYLTSLAREYARYNSEPETLFTAVNQLDENILDRLIQDYGEFGSNLQPVNLLRYDLLLRRKRGETIDGELVEGIKQSVRDHDVTAFPYLPADLKKQLENLQTTGRDIFANWQRHWTVLYPFIYRDEVRAEVERKIRTLAESVIRDIDLPDYTYHAVDFRGASNFGTDRIWIAFYPRNRGNHRNAHQLMIRILDRVVVGENVGDKIGPSRKESEQVEGYEALLEKLEGLKDRVVSRNQSLSRFFKFDAETLGLDRKEVLEKGVIRFSFQRFDFDLTNCSSLEELNEKLGFSNLRKSSRASLCMFDFKSAEEGDVLFFTRGRSQCNAVAVFEGDYYFEPGEGDEVGSHCRRFRILFQEQIEQDRYFFTPHFFGKVADGQAVINAYADRSNEFRQHFDANEISYSVSDVLDTEVPDELVEIPRSEGSINFWWLNANPSMWKIDEYEEGQRQRYTSHNERGNKRRVYRYFEMIKPGDILVGYTSSPKKQVSAICEVTRGLHIGPDGQECFEFEIKEKLEVPVFWNEIKSVSGFENSEVYKNNQGSLFSLTPEEFDLIREIIDEKNIKAESGRSFGQVHRYSFADDPDRPFIREDKFNLAVETLKRKKNIVLQGAPGVGKTFLAKKIAYQMMGFTDDMQIETVQFHQSYSYEDFIQGLRPTPSGSFEIRSGIFHSFCQRAISHPTRDFFLIIDEINRGNLSKIFGELMMLIEADKRGDGNSIRLTYSEDDADRFHVPENLHIIGTMNTADRSLALVDYALRRRFAFIDIEPEFDDNFSEFLSEKGLDAGLIRHICSRFNDLNRKISADPNLGRGFQIGHSYFATPHNGPRDEKWYANILEFEIRPLLNEMWFDNPETADNMWEGLRF